MIGRLICLFKGHKRGKRVSEATSNGGAMFADFRCPRCKATWTRKAKAVAA
ncbi:MAG TPA: hypothetical protein VF516_03370 [Kofleriaceae bacterium]